MSSATSSLVRNVTLGVMGALLALGIGQEPGEGTCEEYWVVGDLSVPQGTPRAERRVRGGTGDLKLCLPTGEELWCSSHHCRPWRQSDEVPVD